MLFGHFISLIYSFIHESILGLFHSFQRIHSLAIPFNGSNNVTVFEEKAICNTDEKQNKNSTFFVDIQVPLVCGFLFIAR